MWLRTCSAPESESAFSKATEELRALIRVPILWNRNGALLNKLFFLRPAKCQCTEGRAQGSASLGSAVALTIQRDTEKMAETGGFSPDLSRIWWSGELGG